MIKLAMKLNRIILIIIILVFCIMTFTGCWNYREVEQLAIVAGAAIDKNPDGTIHLTVEVVNIAGDGQVTYEPVYLDINGETFFQAARRAITLEGKRLYWSHAKSIIISQEIAKEDTIKYIDFLFRDAEAREDTWLFVSTEKTAGEILRSKSMLYPIVSYELDNIMRSQKSISRFPLIEMYEFFDRLFYEQVASILPTVHLNLQHEKKTPQVEGSAIIKGKKLVGFLDAEQTKSTLWLRDEIEGGIEVIKNITGKQDDVSLEIYNSKSKITPMLQDEVLKMKVEVETDVSIGEIAGTTDFITSSGQQKLIKAAQKQIEDEIKSLYYMVRDKYGADIFGFGRRIEIKLPYVWSQIKNDWDKYFAEMELDVKVKVKLRGSATTRIPLKIGE